MKNKIRFIVLAALAAATVIGAASCSKSSSSSASPYTMTATKGGTTATFSGSSSVYAVISGPLLEVEGITTGGGDTTGYIFQLGNYTGAGTYALDGTVNVGEYLTKTPSSASVLFAAHGTFTVGSVSTTSITGTFSFSATDSSKVTNGTFTAKL